MKKELRALIISQFLDGWGFVQLAAYHNIQRLELAQVIRDNLNKVKYDD